MFTRECDAFGRLDNLFELLLKFPSVILDLFKTFPDTSLGDFFKTRSDYTSRKGLKNL